MTWYYWLGVALFIAWIFMKCRFWGHIWRHFVWGKRCIWCGKTEVRK